jgi:hypothetical protein
LAFAGDERRLFNAAHGTEFGALLAHLAGGVVGAGAAPAGAEGAVADSPLGAYWAWSEGTLGSLKLKPNLICPTGWSCSPLIRTRQFQ